MLKLSINDATHYTVLVVHSICSSDCEGNLHWGGADCASVVDHLALLIERFALSSSVQWDESLQAHLLTSQSEGSSPPGQVSPHRSVLVLFLGYDSASLVHHEVFLRESGLGVLLGAIPHPSETPRLHLLGYALGFPGLADSLSSGLWSFRLGSPPSGTASCTLRGALLG